MSLSITRTYADNTDLTEAQLDAAFDSIETKFNTTGIATDELQASCVTTAKLDTGAVTSAKLDSASVTLAKLAAEVSAFLMPTGTIVAYGGTAAPTGWLMCDGSAVSRSTYSALFGVIAETAGQGDNATTFNVPDLRGRFLRGRDASAAVDPDAASRTAMATGGNTGDALFSVQGYATKAPTNAFTVSDPGTHTHSYNVRNVVQIQSGSGAFVSGQNDSATTTGTSGSHVHTVTGGDNETRPVNANVNYIIKT